MTQDEIIRMAREAGAELYAETLCVNGKDAHDFIERFAALVAAHEREKQAEQEPVAWMAKNGEVCRHGWRKFHAREEDVDRFCTPLYAAPQPVKQEPVGVVNTRGGINWRLGQKPLPPRTHLYAAPVQQEPVGTLTVSKYKGYENGSFDYYGDLPVGSHNLYAAPVRTKDLTDDEIRDVVSHPMTMMKLNDARAVIAADREKNK